jgi:hypothetical protein
MHWRWRDRFCLHIQFHQIVRYLTLIFLISFSLNHGRAEEAPKKSAYEILLSSLHKFQNKRIVEVIDLERSEYEKSPAHGQKGQSITQQKQQIELWTYDTGTAITIALYLLKPTLERGTAFRIYQPFGEQDSKAKRHIYLPALNYLSELKGSTHALDQRIYGLIGLTFAEMGSHFKAEMIGLEYFGNLECRRIRVDTSEGRRLDIWIEKAGSSAIRRAIRYSRDGKEELVLEVDETIDIAGRMREASGTLTLPAKSVTRFKVVKARVLPNDEVGPFSMYYFTKHAKELAPQTTSR